LGPLGLKKVALALCKGERLVRGWLELRLNFLCFYNFLYFRFWCLEYNLRFLHLPSSFLLHLTLFIRFYGRLIRLVMPLIEIAEKVWSFMLNRFAPLLLISLYAPTVFTGPFTLSDSVNTNLCLPSCLVKGVAWFRGWDECCASVCFA